MAEYENRMTLCPNLIIHGDEKHGSNTGAGQTRRGAEGSHRRDHLASGTQRVKNSRNEAHVGVWGACEPPLRRARRQTFLRWAGRVHNIRAYRRDGDRRE